VIGSIAPVSTAPIFIVGTPRSGTTLTARILGGHSAIFAMPIEFFFFQRIDRPGERPGTPARAGEEPEDVVALLRRYAYKKRREKAYWALLDGLFADQALLERLRAVDTYQALLETFTEALTARAGKRRWGNQVPTDLFALERILAFNPDTRILLCVRHPLDFMVSYRNMWQRALRRNKPHKAARNRAYYHPVLTSLFWRLCMARARKALARWPENVMVNRYEDLVGDPERQVRRLCGLLGEDFEPAMLAVESENSSRAVSEKGIFKSSVGQWRTQLSAEEIFLCQRLCRGGMAAFGYEASPSRPRPGRVLKSVAESPFATARALRASAEHSGRSLPYTLRRLLS